MAAEKKATAKVETPKTEAPVKAEAEKKEAVKSEATVKKTVEKKTAAAKKAVEKKAADVKKAVGRKAAGGRKTTTKKAELKADVVLEFGGDAYTQDRLVKIAKDVWKYDLKQKVGDLTSVELYVKPEEHAVYYVMNKEFTGSFYI